MAVWPYNFSAAEWGNILKRVGRGIVEDRVSLVAAGTAFYLVLALFPALAAFVAIFGLIADPIGIVRHLDLLNRVMPEDAFRLVASQIEALAGVSNSALSFGFFFGLLIALWSANNGIKTLFQAMNIAYEEHEKRSFMRLNLIAFCFTLGAMVIAAVLVGITVVIPTILGFLPFSSLANWLLSTLRWPVLLVIAAVSITVIYRYGPSRPRAKLRWQLPGAIVATFIWVLSSLSFSWYLENFSNYNATYGSLGAAVGFLMWVWISMVILVVGAQLNAEMERQTTTNIIVGDAEPRR